MLNVITLFSGYDSQCLALRRLGVEFDLVAWSEIDKAAIKAHDVLFPEFARRNLGDVSKVDWSQIHKPIDLLTYSSPCQDFSQAGLQRGGDAGSGTRSSLLWQVERAIDALHPRYLLLENVVALVGTKFMPLFGRWCRLLENKGYHNTWQVLNAKHYGVPQNRERVFLVSKYHDETPYYFPQPFRLDKRLRDVLEDSVPESYYLSKERVQSLLEHKQRQEAAGNGFGFKPKTKDSEYAGAITTMAGLRQCDNYIAEPLVIGSMQRNAYVGSTEGVAPCINAACGMGGGQTPMVTEPQVQQVGNIVSTGNFSNPQRGRIYSADGISPCLNAESGGGLRPKIISHGHGYFKGRESDETAPTVKCSAMQAQHFIKETTMRVRRLTERELYRLMDVEEHDIDTLFTSDIARTQHARLAGNSIVVGVLYHIFRTLLVDTAPAGGEQMKLF